MLMEISTALSMHLGCLWGQQDMKYDFTLTNSNTVDSVNIPLYTYELVQIYSWFKFYLPIVLGYGNV